MKHIRKLKKKDGFSYRVRFCVNYKEITIGTYPTEEQAILERDKAYSKYGIVPIIKGELTQIELKKIVHYDALTGTFTRLNRSGNAKVGDILGHKHKKNDYWIISIRNTQYRAQRLAFLYMLGYIPDIIDHDDRNKINNAWKNLKASNSSANAKNAKQRVDNKYCITGVNQDSNGSWRARISDNAKKVILLYQGLDFFEACCKRKAAERYYNYHINHGRKQ